MGGLLGVGGGSAIAPLLLLVASLRPAQIAGTTLATVLVIAVVGSVAYASFGNMDLGLVWPIAIGSVLGSAVGALTAKRLSTRLMLVIFLAILPYFALKELWPSFAAPVIAPSLVALASLGLATGLLSGLLGVGGASLVVPCLVGFFLIDHHAAQGIAIGVALADSLGGVVTHARERNINYRLLLYLAAPACVAAVVGALLAQSLSGSVLRNLFGVFMVAVWVIMLVRLIRDLAQKRTRSPAYREISGENSEAGGISSSRSLDRAGLAAAKGLVQAARFGLPGRRFWNTGTIMNLLLVSIPLAVLGELYGLGGVFIFTCSALACVSLSYRLGQATESLGSRLGPVSGGLLNATFGNVAEVIISVVALSHGLFVIVRTTLIGSVLGQLFLVLGTSLLLAGLKHRNLGFNRALVKINVSLMAVAMLVIGLPSLLLAAAPEKAEIGVIFLTPTLCGLLLIIYGVAVVASLRMQPTEEDDGSGPQWTVRKGLVVLAVSTGGMVFISELLVDSILPFAEATGISQFFIGLILIPIFSNVVDHIVAVTVALKNKMDLSLTISVGSAAQVACMVLPLIVFFSLAMGQPLGLIFAPVELIPLGAGLLLMVPVLLDGKSNWLEGAGLLACYLVLALVLLVI